VGLFVIFLTPERGYAEDLWRKEHGSHGKILKQRQEERQNLKDTGEYLVVILADHVRAVSSHSPAILAGATRGVCWAIFLMVLIR
jgi:hypothetical protein